MPMNWPFTDVVGHWFYTGPMCCSPALSSHARNPYSSADCYIVFIFINAKTYFSKPTKSQEDKVIGHLKIHLVTRVCIIKITPVFYDVRNMSS